MHEIILASESPRRLEILQSFSLPFQQISSGFDEASISWQKDPSEYACAIAKGKALSLAFSLPNKVIISADTIVYKAGKVYGKPKDFTEAFNNIYELSGCWHSVFSAIALTFQGRCWVTYEESQVLFNELTESQIEHYLNSIHWNDKAGGYAIQLPGGLLVKKINGCYYNVLGLPINSLRSLLKQVDIDLWNYLKRG